MTPTKLAQPEANYLQILAFEADNPLHTPDRDLRIRRELLITPVRYYSLLHRAAESMEGIAAHPVTARLVRERAVRRSQARLRRTARRRFAA